MINYLQKIVKYDTQTNTKRSSNLRKKTFNQNKHDI